MLQEHGPVSALQFIPVRPLVVVVLLFAAAAVAAGVSSGRRRRSTRRGALTSARVLLVGALVAVVAVTQFGLHGGSGINLVPFRGIASELGNVNRQLGVLNLVGNVVMFVPIGLLTPVAMEWRWGRTVLAGALFSVALEVVQVGTGRSGDVDDVLLNTVGTGLGAVAGVLLAGLVRGRSTTHEELPAVEEDSARISVDE